MKSTTNQEIRLLNLLANKVDGIIKTIQIINGGIDDSNKGLTSDAQRQAVINDANDMKTQIAVKDAQIRDLINKTEILSDAIENLV